MQNVISKLLGLGLLCLAGSGTIAEAQTPLDRQLDSLFVIASSAEIHYQDLREPAMDEMATYGADAVPFLVGKFETKSAWERWTVLWIFQRIGATAVPGLLQALKLSDGMVVQRVCWALGDIGDSSAVDGLMGVADHERWQVRDQALQALGKIGDTKAGPVVVQAFEDTIGQVRKSAVVTAGQLKLKEATVALVHELGDDFYGARLMAVNSLLSLDTAEVLSVLTDSLESVNKSVGDLACQILGEIGNDQAIRLLLTQTESPDPDRRAHAAVALVRADPQDNCRLRAQYYDGESDRLVRLKIESALNAINDE